MGSGKGKMVLRLEPDPLKTVLLKPERASEPRGARSTPRLPYFQDFTVPRAPGTRECVCLMHPGDALAVGRAPLGAAAMRHSPGDGVR